MTPHEGINYLMTVPRNEPVFVLRAQDLFAPSTVGVWAALCLAQNAVDKDGNPLHPETLAKGDRAMELSKQMRKFQEQHGCKVPD